MTANVYTAMTFAPVQGFIEKSRKLRDLYGSSYILSFLAWAVCYTAKKSGCQVISPALINVTQGMPNQIIIAGDFPEADAKRAFSQAWSSITQACRTWIETLLPHPTYTWKRDWGLWEKYAWELFWAQDESGSLAAVRQRLNEIKRSRDWVGINWTGESSTLSGADAIAWPNLGNTNPRHTSYRQQQTEIRAFYTALSEAIGEAFIDPDEELSVPELIKRIVTHDDVATQVLKTFEHKIKAELTPSDVQNLKAIATELNPKSFKDLNRHKKTEPKYWTGWFLGDGDSAGKYLRQHSTAEVLHAFSAQMREWGNAIRNPENSYLPGQGRMIYAGGDDFMGVLYERDDQIQPTTCFQWLSQFNAQFWQGTNLQPNSGTQFQHGANQPKPITASVGFVWAAPNVPQRDVLQHCREAEKSAKRKGRDRIAFRILFNGGNSLEWVCPWWLLEGDFSQATVPVPWTETESSKPPQLMQQYRDRNGVQASRSDPNWTHLYNDVGLLEARHAFQTDSTEVALGLVAIYFGEPMQAIIGHPQNWWNRESEAGDRLFSGILGNPKAYLPTDEAKDPMALAQLAKNPYVIRDLNDWVINLAKVGFHLHRDYSKTALQAA